MRKEAILNCRGRLETSSQFSTWGTRGLRASPLPLAALLAFGALGAFGQSAAVLPASQRIRTLGQPLNFEKSSAPGQEFSARGKEHKLVLAKDGAALSAHGSNGTALRMSFSGADPRASISGEEELPGKVYHASGAMIGPLHGNPTFRRVRYSGIYPGIDAVYYGNDRQLEFDLDLAPHANPKAIHLAFSGAHKMHLTGTGEVAIQFGDGEVVLRKPSIYQERDGVRTEIAGNYVRRGKAELGFELAAYDPELPLTIDPSIAFATYLGGPGNESAEAVKVAKFGEIYVASSSDSVSSIPSSQQFPIEAPQSGFEECFLTKLSADGSEELYTVIFNGVRCEAMDIQPGLVHLSMGKSGNYLRTLREDATGQPSSLDLLQGAYDFDLGPVEELRADSAGNIYLVAFDQPNGSPNPIYELQKIDSHGQLLGTFPLITAAINQPGNVTYEQVTGLDVDDAGNAYVVGIDRLNGVITPTANAFQAVKPSNGADDAFLLRVNTSTPAAFQIDYATFLGGSSADEARQVAFDSSTSTVLVAGDTTSANFPITSGSPSYNGPSGTGFLTRLDLSQPASSQLAGSVLMSPSSSTASLLTVLPGGIPAMIGTAFDSGGIGAGFFLVNPIYPALLTGEIRPFLRTYTPDLSQITFSTYLDNVPGNTFAAALAANGTQSLYVAVATSDGTLGTQGAFHSSGLGGSDVLLRGLDVTSLVPADQPPVISFTPANLSLSIIVPDQPAVFPLACGQLFQCSIQDPEGDALTDFAWYGPNGYHLEQADSSTGVPPSDTLSLAAGTYTFTLKVRDARGAIGSGMLTVDVAAQNTFPTQNNPETIQLTDELFDSPGNVYFGNVHPATITFPSVTNAGLTWLQSRADLNPAPPSGMQAGSPPYYYDIHTTAAFSGPATLCMDMTGMSFADAADVQLYELRAGVWTPLAAGMQGNSLCANTDLSNVNGGDRSTTVAFFYPQVPATAITAIAGTGYAEGSIDGPGGNPLDDAPNGVPALQSALTQPAGLAIQPFSRTLYVSESGNTAAIRGVNLDTQQISMIVPNGGAIGGGPLTIDPSGAYLYYVAPVDSPGAPAGGAPAEEIVQLNLFNSVTTVIAGGVPCCDGPEPASGQPATSSFLTGVNSLLVDFEGNVFLTRDGTSAVLRVNSSDGSWTVVLDEDPHSTSGAPTSPYLDFPRALAFDNQSYLLAGGQTLVRVSPGPDGTVDGSSSSTATFIGGIPAVNMGGYAQPFAGDGLPATQAALSMSYTMFVGQDGAVIFDDGITHRVRRIDPGADGIVNGDSDEIVQTIAGYYRFTQAPPSGFATSSYGDFRGLVQDPLNNNIYAADYAGDQVFAIGPRVIPPVNTAPQANAVFISGDPRVGQQLMGQYVYSDADGDLEGVSTFRWLRDGVPIAGANAKTYAVAVADLGHTIAFEVTPAAATGVSPGTAVQSGGVTIVNSVPVASNVSITGSPDVGSVLTGVYTYSDADGDLQGTSLLQWLRDGTPVTGAVTTSYAATQADAGHSISFQVTPVAQTGATPGIAVQSAAVEIVQAPAFTSGTSATFNVGSHGAFTFTAMGTPAPTFSVSPPLPGGLSLNSATGLLDGTPVAGTAGVHALTVTASNGASPDATQSFTLTINDLRAVSSTALMSSLNPSPVGQAVTFTASVTGQSPTGTATFTDGGVPIGSPMLLSGGSASLTTSALLGGGHSIVCSYSGDSGNLASASPVLVQTVNRAISSVLLFSSPNPPAVAQPVTFTAIVSGFAPSGAVTFMDGATVLGSSNLVNSGGTEAAIFQVSSLGAGPHSIVASYGGDADNLPGTSLVLSVVLPHATQPYIVTDLGTLGRSSFAYGINNNGQVTGASQVSDQTSHAFLISPPYTQMIDLDTLGSSASLGQGINSMGQVAGTYVSASRNDRAFLISAPYTSMTDLGDLGGEYSSGYGINDSGQVTGYAETADRERHAFLWDGAIQDLGTLGGVCCWSSGYAINNAGQITGFSDTATNTDAFLYTPGGGPMVDLGNLGGCCSEGLGINASGQIAGETTATGTIEDRAFLWDGTMHNIGTLGDTESYSVGYGINASGQITGTSTTESDQHAFLYTSLDGIVDLNSLIPIGSGWTLTAGTAINDAGQITGYGIRDNDPNFAHAFVLTPPPPPLGAFITGTAVAKPPSGTANAVFAVTFNNPGSQPVAVNFNTADGTAHAGSDYVAASGTLMFAPGITTQPVTVQIFGGIPNASNLTFSVRITTVADGSILATGVGTILVPARPVQIVYTLLASPQSLAFIASASASTTITLQSENGVSETAQLSAAWIGTPPAGATFTPSSSSVTIPADAHDPASATLTVNTPATLSPGVFTLRVTSTSASGATRFVDISINVTAALAAPACGCTKTGPFVNPRVEGLVAPTVNPLDPSTGIGPGGFATVTTSSSQLTLTRNTPDQKIIIDGATNLSAYGFSPNGKLFVLITQPSPGLFYLNLYSIPQGGLVSQTSPLATNALSWGFSPDDDNRYFLVTTSTSLPTHIDINIYDTQSGAAALSTSLTNYFLFGPPPWSDETDVEEKDSDDDASDDSADTTGNDNNQVGGWGFSPDGNTFVASYKTDLSTYSLSFWNLTRNSNTPVIGDWPVHDVAAFWQFSPCSDLFMWIHQQGANPSINDPVDFLFTSNGRPYPNPAHPLGVTLNPSQGAPSASAIANPDGSTNIQLTAMSLTSIACPQCSASMTIHSPANIALSDAESRRTGFDVNTGGSVNQIPGGAYTGVGSEPQTVTIPYVAGAYLLDAYGLASLTSPQSYRLTFAETDASGDMLDQTDFSGTTSAGLDQRFAFTIGNGPIQPLPMPVPPTVTFTGAPSTAVYQSTFAVAATTNASTAATIVASGSCSIAGTLVTMTSGAGTCNLTASWPADSHYLAATANQSTTATKAASAVAITSNTPNPSTPGQAVAVKFQVTGNGSPSGSVSITASTGETCAGTLATSAGSCSLTFATAGARTLVANYPGDANFNGSTSAAVAQSVNAIGAIASLSPASVNFGTVYLGLPAVQVVTLSNVGSVAMTVGKVQVSGGTDHDDFAALSLCPPTLAPGKNCKITIGFLADSDNYNPTAVLNVNDSAPDSPQSLPLSATIISPKAGLSSDAVDFGKQKAGTTSAVRTVKLTNTGTTPLALSSVTINGDFALASGTTCTNGMSLKTGASCTINVTFTPASKGGKMGGVTIKDNALINPQIIVLSGTGI